MSSITALRPVSPTLATPAPRLNRYDVTLTNGSRTFEVQGIMAASRRDAYMRAAAAVRADVPGMSAPQITLSVQSMTLANPKLSF